jgi:hypothetical protein
VARRDQDIDITPNPERENLQRLADALNELDARFLVDGYPDGFAIPGGLDRRSFPSQQWLNLVTRHGRVDVAMSPSGIPGGYRELRLSATREAVPRTDVTVLVSSARDIVRSKTAAGRVKDQLQLPELIRDLGVESANPGHGLELE